MKTKESCIWCLGFKILRKNLIRFTYTALRVSLSSHIQGNVSAKCPLVFSIYVDLLTPSNAELLCTRYNTNSAQAQRLLISRRRLTNCSLAFNSAVHCSSLVRIPRLDRLTLRVDLFCRSRPTTYVRNTWYSPYMDWMLESRISAIPGSFSIRRRSSKKIHVVEMFRRMCK